MPVSEFSIVAVTAAPTGTRTDFWSNARFAARKVRLTEEARGG